MTSRRKSLAGTSPERRSSGREIPPCHCNQTAWLLTRLAPESWRSMVRPLASHNTQSPSGWQTMRAMRRPPPTQPSIKQPPATLTSAHAVINASVATECCSWRTAAITSNKTVPAIKRSPRRAVTSIVRVGKPVDDIGTLRIRWLLAFDHISEQLWIRKLQ
jgi:hypothetical protein